MAQNTLNLRQLAVLAAILAAVAAAHAAWSVPATRALIHDEAVSRDEFGALREDIQRLEERLDRRLSRIEERLPR